MSGYGNKEKKKKTLQDSNLLTRGGSGNKEAKRGSKLLGSPCHRQPWSSRHRSFLWFFKIKFLKVKFSTSIASAAPHEALGVAPLHGCADPSDLEAGNYDN